MASEDGPARTLRTLWAAVCLAGAAALGVFGALAATATSPPLAEHADLVFYATAAVGMAGLAAGFGLLRAMETRLNRAGSDAEAGAALRTYGLMALAAVEGSAVAAGVGALLSGDLLPLAFGAPLFAFAWLTWPSDGRVAHWLALRRR